MTKNALKAIEIMVRDGWSPIAAFGLIGGFQHESGSKALNTKALYKKEDSFGIGQWRGRRLENLRAFAKHHSKPDTDLEIQVVFAEHELVGSEKKAGAWLKEARTVEQSAAAAMAFERPAHYHTPSHNASWDVIIAHAKKGMAWKQRYANALALQKEWAKHQASKAL